MTAIPPVGASTPAAPVTPTPAAPPVVKNDHDADDAAAARPAPSDKAVGTFVDKAV